MKNRVLITGFTILWASLFVTVNLGAQDEDQPQAPPQVQPQEQPAVPPQQGQPQSPPPAQAQTQTAAARISVIHGNVTTMHGDGGEWLAGTVNTPLVVGDSVATSEGSRAEVQLDFANLMRLAGNTQAKVADLEQSKLDIQLASGLIVFTALKDTQTDAEIDTPNMGVHLLSPGVFRIQVTSPTETQLIVIQGQAEVLTNQGSTKVQPGQMIQVRGSDNPEYKVDSAPGRDDFDKWCSERDRQIETAQAWQHTDRRYTGASDLDTYGQWEQVPDYGWCWTPQVDAGWVPYSAGNWGWEPYWGWTWISHEPWGWAPYHYGRWFMYGNRWAWWPAAGVFGPRPIWAPAYVSFFGFGGGGFGFGLGFGLGSIGWLALGPRDIFHPWWGAGHGFGVRGFNEFHGAEFIHPGGPRFGSNLEGMMNDARIRGAIRNVSARDFASGHMVHSMPVSEGMLRGGSMMRGALPVAHTAASMGMHAGTMSNFRGASTDHFFSRGGAAAGRSYTMTGRAGGGAEGFGARSNSMGAGRPTGNWQHYASPSARAPEAGGGARSGWQGGGSPAARGAQNDWHRYASPSPYSGRSGAGYGQSAQRGGYSNGPRNYSGGGNYGRSEGSTYGGGSRQPLELNRPIMRQRAPSGGYYGGGRGYSAPSGGNRGYSAPKGGGSGGGHSYSAPKSGGGGGGHVSGGGGGGHSSGGGGGHGRR
jgi:hypothetical protein